jgi:Protein of unknown function (DUF642)
MFKVVSTALRLTCVVILLFAGSSVAYAQVTNPSFETPTVTPGTFTNFLTGSPLIPGWAVVGLNNTEVSIVSGTFQQGGITFEAQNGNQWLDLTGDGTNSTAEGVSQAVSTIAGHSYLLSYFIGNTTGGGGFGTTSTVNVSINGTATFSDTNSNIDATGLDWKPIMHTFVASGSTTTLAFFNGDGPGDNSNGLDTIALTDQGVAGVAEPASGALLVSGLLGLGLLSRRKRSK